MIALAASLLAVVPATALGQEDLSGLLGTTILNDTLTNLGLTQPGMPPAPDSTTPPADGTPTTPGGDPTQQQPATPPAPAHALGWYCSGELRKHVRGQKRTPFSQCVTAMAKLQKGTTASAATACGRLSHKHVRGMKRTPYSACVAGAKKLLAERTPG